MQTRFAISLGAKNFAVKNTFGSLHRYIYIVICSCVVFLAVSKYLLDLEKSNKMIVMTMMMPFLNLCFFSMFCGQ